MDNEEYTLEKNGDSLEKGANGIFLKQKFPNYELFWKKFVVGLTNRPINIRFKEDFEISPINKVAHASICIAQLHYSSLCQLISAYEIKSSLTNTHLNKKVRQLTSGLVFLCGAIDIAEEMVERYLSLDKIIYDPWNEFDGKKARSECQKKFKEPPEIKHLRNYRNRLVHGRLMPTTMLIISPGEKLKNRIEEILVPRPGKEESYLDWRELINKQNIDPLELSTPQSILDNAFIITIKFINELEENIIVTSGK